MRRFTPSRSAAGFTLLELLVVIAILGVLFSLLLVAIQKARFSAQSVQCKSNLKQMGIALISFTDSNGGKLMPASTWNYTQPSGPTNREMYWFGEVTGPNTVDRQAGFLMPFLENKASSWKSSNTRKPRRGLFCCRAAGSWSGPSVGWAVFAGSHATTND